MRNVRHILATTFATISLLAASFTPANAATTDQYIILGDTLKDTVTAVTNVGATPEDKYKAVAAVTADLTDTQAAALEAKGYRVAEDLPIHADTEQTPTPSWGLDRIDQTSPILNGTYSYDDNAAGQGVTIYVIDSGINPFHQEFAGRIAPGFDTVKDDLGTDDCTGHGSHVAGIAAGRTVGVAPKATIVPVRIFDCDGHGQGGRLVKALNWIIQHHQEGTPAVINMSLSSAMSDLYNEITGYAIADGIVVVAAAGNDKKDACNYSPASTPEILTVAATAPNDARAAYSNYGTCVDIFAPGGGQASQDEQIYSASFDGDDSYDYMSGTSMATPHVAGVAARYLSTHPTATPAEVNEAIINDATPDAVTNPGTGSPNKLLHIAASTPLVPGIKPSAPMKASATPVGFETAKITWTKPEANGTDAIRYYSVKITTTDCKDLIWSPQVVLVDAPTTTVTVPYFYSGCHYTASITATNSYGSGPTISTNEFVPFSAASAPRSVKTYYKKTKWADLTWTAPEAFGYAKFIRYEIRFSKNETKSSWGTWRNVGKNKYYSAYGIPKGITRYAQIRAVTTAGNGETVTAKITPAR